ncbi:hypothetical protein C8Q79DRAFT_901514 [Trametes meyenii]|nr:hypothetical protein C8Q79DRAFT_901514 [Trametes meyenii]
MRQKGISAEDQRFRTALENLRVKACTNEDRALFRSRVVTRDGVLSRPELADVSVITTLNAHRDAINEIGVEAFARRYHRKLHTFYSIDRWTSDRATKSTRKTQLESDGSLNPVRLNDAMCTEFQWKLWDLHPCLTDHVPGVLRMCRGMPVLLKNNEATELCATNGAEGIVYDWHSHATPDGFEVLDTLFVKLVNPPREVQVDGLPTNVIPITRTKTRVKCGLPDFEKPLVVDRDQVMVLPNFAMTDFASQGKSRWINLCHLKYCATSQSLYTCLSRSTSFQRTYILEGFDDSKTMGGLSQSLRREFQELEIMDYITRHSHGNTLPATISRAYRGEAIRGFLEWKGNHYVPQGVHPALSWANEGFFWTDTRSKADTRSMPSFVNPRGTANHVRKKTDRSTIKNVSNSRKKRPLDVEPSGTVKRRKGFIWDRINYSCAYDSLFTVVIHLNLTSPAHHMERVRDDLRDYLYGVCPVRFPRYGAVLAAVSDVLDALFTPMQYYGLSMASCTSCHAPDSASVSRQYRSPIFYITRGVLEVTHSQFQMQQTFVEDMMQYSFNHAVPGACTSCGSRLHSNIKIMNTLPFIFLEIHLMRDDLQRMIARGSISFTVRTQIVTWYLCGVIYLGGEHFTSRYIDDDGVSWYHDGMITGRTCIREDHYTNLNLWISRDRTATHLIYWNGQ